MSGKGKGRLGERLVEAGNARREDVESAAAEAQSRHLRLGEVILERAIAPEREVYQILAEQRGLKFSEASELLALIDAKLSTTVPRKFLDHVRVIPVVRQGRHVIVATCDPDAHVPELASALRASKVEIRLITPLDYRRLRMAVDLRLAAHAIAPAGGARVRDLLVKDPNADAMLVELFEAILLDAVAERASDVHLEKYGDRIRVRLRIDGDLQDVRHFSISPDQLLGLVNIIKINACLDISERRVPQGGRFSITVGTHAYDLRVQTQPSMHGEHVVMRLLSQDTKLLTIEELGFPETLAKSYRRLVDSPAGLVLVVGPTGSGKSTTLYGGLQVLARDSTRKVITIEDPIEYAIDGIQQTQARPDLGFAFANAMRAFVREDPDVILVGEIRDGETALEALRASQTGHLVLSTLHCNDAVDAVQRLLDLGQHPNSIASELLGVFAQRLAKRLCSACRIDAPSVDPDLRAEVFPDGPPPDFAPKRGRGCARCNHLGTHGRIAVVEYLPAGPAVRAGVAARLPVDELRRVALEADLRPMREHALDLVRAGVIAFEELKSLLPPERLAPERSGRKTGGPRS